MELSKSLFEQKQLIRKEYKTIRKNIFEKFLNNQLLGNQIESQMIQNLYSLFLSNDLISKHKRENQEHKNQNVKKILKVKYRKRMSRYITLSKQR